MLKMVHWNLIAGCVLAAGTLLAQESKEAASTSNDRQGSIQSGVQSLVDKLVAGMNLSDSEGLSRIAVLPFETTSEGEQEVNLGKMSAALLSSRLAAKPGIMQVERGRLNDILSEVKRSEKGQVSKKSAVSVGKLVGANNVILGTLSPSGAEYLLTARIVDSETGRIVSMADHSFSKQGMVALSEDLVELKSPEGAAARSAVLPGWGQWYNGQSTKGVTIATVFLGLAVSAATTAALASGNASKYQENRAETVQYRQEANDQYQTVNQLLYGMAGVWAIGVVDAYLFGDYSTIIDVSDFEESEIDE